MNKKSNQYFSAFNVLLREAYPALGCAMFFSLFINILMLTVPLYMLQLFDRVLTSQSIDTLIYLTLIAVFALIVMTLLDISRSRMLLCIGQWFDQKLGSESLLRSIDANTSGDSYHCLSYVNTVRQFLSGSSIVAFFDAPWIGVYLLIIYFLSVPLGVVATVGALILIVLAYINEKVSRLPNQKSNELYTENSAIVASMLKNSEAIRAMGMQRSLARLWSYKNNYFLTIQKNMMQRSYIIIELAKLIRFMLQILILCLGAYYVIQGELSAGGMIAASIIMGRGLAPIEQGMGAWKAMLDVLGALRRLKEYWQVSTESTQRCISQPEGMVQVEDVSFVVEGRPQPVLQNIKFSLQSGKQLAIVGPIAAGKSTLARLLAGISQPTYGVVRLDTVDICQIQDEMKGTLIGYLSQGDTLFPGSIKENINRLSGGHDADVIEAAQFVNLHSLIQRMPTGYETPVQGYHLSVGERQRVALARAFYQKPQYVILDEPESNLDADGLLSLRQSLQKAREIGITVIYVTQHPELARVADFALVLKQGRIQEYGLASQVIEHWLG